MVSQDLSLEEVSNRNEELKFPESVVQYLRGDIGVTPIGSSELLRSKVLKYHNLDTLEGRPRAELGEYNFDKADEELRTKYSFYEIYNKKFLINWKNYEAVYGNVAHQLPTNLLPKPMKEGGGVEVEVGTGKSSIIRMVTTESEFLREEATRLVMDQNATINSRGGWEKSTGAEEVGSTIPGVVMGLKVKVGYEKVEEEIVRKWGQSIVGYGAYVL